MVTRDEIVDGLILTYSTLHICPSLISTLSRYLVEIQCSTTNGLSPPIGLQSASFTASPFSELVFEHPSPSRSLIRFLDLSLSPLVNLSNFDLFYVLILQLKFWHLM